MASPFALHTGFRATMLVAASLLWACDARPAGGYDPAGQESVATAYVISSGCTAKPDKKLPNGLARVVAVNGQEVSPLWLGVFVIKAGPTRIKLSGRDTHGTEYVSTLEFFSLPDQIYQPYAWQQGHDLVMWVKNSQTDAVVAGTVPTMGSFSYYPCWLLGADKPSSAEPVSDPVSFLPPQYMDAPIHQDAAENSGFQ